MSLTPEYIRSSVVEQTIHKLAGHKTPGYDLITAEVAI